MKKLMMAVAAVAAVMGAQAADVVKICLQPVTDYAKDPYSMELYRDLGGRHRHAFCAGYLQ